MLTIPPTEPDRTPTCIHGVSLAVRCMECWPDEDDPWDDLRVAIDNLRAAVLATPLFRAFDRICAWMERRLTRSR